MFRYWIVYGVLRWGTLGDDELDANTNDRMNHNRIAKRSEHLPLQTCSCPRDLLLKESTSVLSDCSFRPVPSHSGIKSGANKLPRMGMSSLVPSFGSYPNALPSCILPPLLHFRYQTQVKLAPIRHQDQAPFDNLECFLQT